MDSGLTSMQLSTIRAAVETSTAAELPVDRIIVSAAQTWGPRVSEADLSLLIAEAHGEPGPPERPDLADAREHLRQNIGGARERVFLCESPDCWDEHRWTNAPIKDPESPLVGQTVGDVCSWCETELESADTLSRVAWLRGVLYHALDATQLEIWRGLGVWHDAIPLPPGAPRYRPDQTAPAAPVPRVTADPVPPTSTPSTEPSWTAKIGRALRRYWGVPLVPAVAVLWVSTSAQEHATGYHPSWKCSAGNGYPCVNAEGTLVNCPNPQYYESKFGLGRIEMLTKCPPGTRPSPGRPFRTP
jgi:hypothetical protein